MANVDTVNTLSGVEYNQGANIGVCRLTIADGSQYDLKNLIVELSYFEDLYGFCTSGYVMLRDAVGFIEAFQLSGKEFIEIKFNTFNDDKVAPSKYMVYKIGNRRPTGNMNSEFYCLYFCTAELIYSEQIKISNAYSGQQVDYMINDILTNKVTGLGVSSDRVFAIEATLGTLDLVVPTLKPFEAISWLSTYALPKTTGAVGADMVLFENKNGFNFRSINTMKNNIPYGITYRYQQNNLDPETKDLQLETDSVLDFEIIRSFDTLKSVSSGAYANRVLAIDPLTRNWITYDFDYGNYVSELKPVNGAGILPDFTNPQGKKANQTYEGNMKVVWGNPNAIESFVIDKFPGGVAKDINIGKTLTFRTSQMSLANHTVIKIVVPGNADLQVGMTLNFNMYSLQLASSSGAKDSRNLDPYYSGKYLVTAVRHILQSQNVYQTVLELAKDSSSAAYQAVSTVKK